MSEIAQRLKAVTSGAATQEFVLRRNQVGQLGFHVQHDGLITEVENFGYAWQSGLRQGSRLVEVKNVFTHNLIVDIKELYFQTLIQRLWMLVFSSKWFVNISSFYI